MSGNSFLYVMMGGSLLAAIGAMVGQVLQFMGTRRAASGSTASSDARTVWEREEASYQRMKEMYESRLKARDERLAACEEENRSLRDRVAKLQADIDSIRDSYCSKDECQLRIRQAIA